MINGYYSILDLNFKHNITIVDTLRINKKEIPHQETQETKQSRKLYFFMKPLHSVA